MSLPEHKIKSLVKQWKLWSKALWKIKSNNDRLLITILIGNNLVNVYTAALATTIAISLWEASGFEQATAVWIATWIVTFLLLLFWEIIPKSLATKNATKISLLVAPIYSFLMLVLYPAISFMEILIKVFSWKWKVEKISDEEIESFIDMWKHSWTLEEWEHKKIKNILEFWDIDVEEIMTPRVKIDALDDDVTVWEAKAFYMKHTHSRIPVFEERIDRIDYFITLRDLLNQGEDKKLKELELKKALKVPLNQPIDKLLETFQKTHRHLAIVIDEYGWVAGLVTLEDVIEEIFWEIRDETDKEVDEISEQETWWYKVQPQVSIENILEKFWLVLSNIWLDEKEFDGETVSFVLTYKLERFPNEWENISFNIKWSKKQKLEFKVSWIKEWKMGMIEVKRI